MTVSSSNSATVKIGRQASQLRVRGMKYMPDSRQNCLAPARTPDQQPRNQREADDDENKHPCDP